MSKKITINLSGSKSLANRALICNTLAGGKLKLINLPECDDVKYMVEALEAIKNKKQKIKNIDVGNAGTAMRFLTTYLGMVVAKAKLSSKKLSFVLTGDKQMSKRPIQDLLDALNQLGISVASINNNGCPPIEIKNKILKVKKFGGRCELKGDASSQYLSSILLCAPYFDKDTTIEIIGELTSKPYVDMTIAVMRDFGVRVENKKYSQFHVKAGQKYTSRKYQIEPDASAASYFIAGSVLTGKKVEFPGLYRNSVQGDAGFLAVVKKMTNSKLKMSNLRGISVDLNYMPDTVQTLSVLAMFAKGTTKIVNVANLRIKETDRIAALVCEIKKFRVEAKEMRDGLEIVGNPKLKFKNLKLKINVYNDHRMAMAFAVAKLVIPDIIIENPDCVSKSFPKFWKEWKKLL